MIQLLFTNVQRGGLARKLANAKPKPKLLLGSYLSMFLVSQQMQKRPRTTQVKPALISASILTSTPEVFNNRTGSFASWSLKLLFHHYEIVYRQERFKVVTDALLRAIGETVTKEFTKYSDNKIVKLMVLP